MALCSVTKGMLRRSGEGNAIVISRQLRICIFSTDSARIYLAHLVMARMGCDAAAGTMLRRQ